MMVTLIILLLSINSLIYIDRDSKKSSYEKAVKAYKQWIIA